MGTAAYDPSARIAKELDLTVRAVTAVVQLLGEGGTVPFIARYRKEASGGLDEVQIRAIVERRDYLVELDNRRGTVLAEIERQGELSSTLRARIEAASTKGELEDLYAPYKPKRRTRAVMAKERGLEPLADLLWQQSSEHPGKAAARFVDPAKDVPDVAAAMAGARDICAERIADDARARDEVRRALRERARVSVRKAKAHAKVRTKFDDHVGRDEPLRRLAGHRYLALCRGEAEGVLKLGVSLPDEERVLARLEQIARLDPRSRWAAELAMALRDGLTRLLLPRAEGDLRAELKERADREAVEVFARNLRDLLLAPPFGERPVLAIDPGQRTGCKCAALDATGKLLAYDTLFLVQGDSKLARSRETLVELVRRHRADAVAVGNGTHGRETEAFVRDTLRDASLGHVLVVSVNESGASIYSASDVAREELGEVDVVVRGAVSIGRRLQDPLAELVKIDPKSIGVGQYQHDVQPALLARKLDEVVEDCVNAVGVELNTASAPLLARVAGLGPKQGKAIVSHRQKHGRFSRRQEVLEVSGVGPKTFEQAAGFLRIRGGKEPLDGSAVHPERYPLVQRMARDLGVKVTDLIGNRPAVTKIDAQRYVAGDVGRFTVDDILAELLETGRDPRAGFEAPSFRDDVRTMNDLAEGMMLEGVVTNVTDFGAFVDVGVKQDGLVHISQLSDRFVKHPRDVVAVGDRLNVRVLSVDLERKRIGLSAKSQG